MKKIFLSSTCYDLKDTRAVIEKHLIKNQIQPLLSDRSNFQINPSEHRHDVCLRTVKESDLFILIIDSRKGAPYYKDTSITITRAEFREARKHKIPVLAFVRSTVFNERSTWKKNINLSSFTPFYAEDITIFEFISEIQLDETGIWIQTFDDVTNIIDRLDNLITLPNIILGESAKYKTIEATPDRNYIDFTNFSDETCYFLLSQYPYKSMNDYLTLEEIKNISDRIPKQYTYLGIVVDILISQYAIKDIVEVIPIKPAEDDGSSWYMAACPTALGVTIKNEIDNFISKYK